MKKPVALIIMDGFGYTKDDEGSAIAKANEADLLVLSVKRVLGVKSMDDEEIENDIYGCKTGI